MLIPSVNIGDVLVTRFRLEPRKSYIRNGSCWLVAFDTQLNDYVKIPGKRAYMPFQNSEEAWNYLKTII